MITSVTPAHRRVPGLETRSIGHVETARTQSVRVPLLFNSPNFQVPQLRVKSKTLPTRELEREREREREWTMMVMTKDGFNF